MNRILRHISIFTAIVAIAACSMVEMPDNLHENKTVEFVVRNTTFSSIDVSVASTKALTGTELTAVERKIVNAYFLVFGEDGTREEFRTLEVTDNTIPSQTLTHDYDNGPIKVCYLANVAEDVASSYETWNDILTKPLAITYPEYNEAYFSTTGHVGIPSLDGELCFPMFNSVTYPGASASNGVVEVQLERLFAKVTVNIKTQFSGWNGSIDLSTYTIDNLPTKVLLNPNAQSDSPWVASTNSADFKDAIKVKADESFSDLGTILSFSELLTLYVPEYYLAAKPSASSNVDQKLKPDMFDHVKRPVHITLNGITHQANFVDVPLKYNLYLGENATNDFNLIRNRQYVHNMTVTGTGEAILGTDTRVEPTYHNLADPTNSGTLNPANCYIISKPGRYLIPMCKGNQPNNTLAGTTAEIQHINHLDNDVNSIPADKISIITIDGKQYIQFDVNMYSGTTFSPTDVVPSNELLCLKDANNNIVWSWHLWMCEDGNRPDEYHHTYPTTGFTVLNRALGATQYQGFELLGYSLSQWFDGLYYQWGRKDPLLPSGNTVASSATYSKSIQNPRIYYTDWKGTYTDENNTDAIGWTSSKSVNDPCPPGYKVPSTGIWRSSPPDSDGLENIMEQMGFDGYPYNLQTTGGLAGNIVYPYSSHIANGSVAPFTPTPYTASVKDRQLATGLYTTIYFSGEKYLYSGELWSSDGGLYFGRYKQTVNDGAQIFIHLDVTVVDRWFPAAPSENTDGYTIGKIQDSLLDSVGKLPLIGGLAKRALQSILNGLGVSIDEIAKRILESFMTVNHEYDPKLKTDNDAISVSHGAHVRCVRE